MTIFGIIALESETLYIILYLPATALLFGKENTKTNLCLIELVILYIVNRSLLV